jgi:hypothetical protein
MPHDVHIQQFLQKTIFFTLGSSGIKHTDNIIFAFVHEKEDPLTKADGSNKMNNERRKEMTKEN